MSDIAIVRPTGVVVRSAPKADGHSNIVGVADYGEVFRGAVSRGDWWIVDGHKYIAAADAVETDVAGRVGRAVALAPASQRDPRWGAVRLGQSSLDSVTIADYGCLLVCFTIVANASLPAPITPDRMNELLKAGGGFMPPGPFGGRVSRFDLRHVTDGRARLVWVSERRPPGDIEARPDTVEKLLHHLRSGMPAILEVDFYPEPASAPAFPGRPGQEQHYVVALPTSADAAREDVSVIDPWTGEVCRLCPRFGASVARSVVRVVLYRIDTAPAITPPARFPTPPSVMLGAHALSDTRSAQRAFDSGCRLFTLVDSYGAAAALADRGAWVMARKSWPTYVPTPDQFMRAIGEPHPRVIYLGLNENDSIGSGADDIRARAAFDVEVARRIARAAGGRSMYAAGSFAAGSPDFEDAGVCRAIRDGYAQAYNAGELWFDMHNSVTRWKGTRSRGDDASLARAVRRWEFLFTRCGFDPRVRGIVSSMAGIDAGAGLADKGGEEFAAFCRAWIDVQSRDLHIARSGEGAPARTGSFTSPYVGGTVFHMSGAGDTRLKAHNMAPYLDHLRATAWA